VALRRKKSAAKLRALDSRVALTEDPGRPQPRARGYFCAAAEGLSTDRLLRLAETGTTDDVKSRTKARRAAVTRGLFAVLSYPLA